MAIDVLNLIKNIDLAHLSPLFGGNWWSPSILLMKQVGKGDHTLNARRILPWLDATR